MIDTDRLRQIIDFMCVTDQMKLIYRTVEISGNGRCESDAEHSWHLALFLMLLEKDLPQKIDTLKLYKMLLIHDMVEIYAGDTPLYDAAARVDKTEREAKAADKLFGQLPLDLKEEFFNLFNEFEAMHTLEAKMAKAFDKIHPLIQNLCSNGTDYKKFHATYNDEKQRIEEYVNFDSTFLQISDFLLDEAKKLGYIE